MRRGEVLKNLLLSAVTVAGSLGAGEGLCRLWERNEPTPVTAPYITDWQSWDDEFYTLKSVAAGWPPWEDYNSEGLRDHEWTVEKPGPCAASFASGTARPWAGASVPRRRIRRCWGTCSNPRANVSRCSTWPSRAGRPGRSGSPTSASPAGTGPTRSSSGSA